MDKLETNTIFPGLVVEYSTDDKQTWRTADLDTSILGTNNVYLRTRSAWLKKNVYIPTLLVFFFLSFRDVVYLRKSY